MLCSPNRMFLSILFAVLLSACASTPVQQNSEQESQSESMSKEQDEPEEQKASLNDLRGYLLPKYETMKRP